MYKKIVLLFVAVLLVSCTKDEGGGNSNKDSFNRKQMLTFWADQMIIPAYKDFQTKITDLETKVNTFTSETPSATNLNAVKTAWEIAYIAWQKASLFQVGKAQELNMAGNCNTYPTSVSRLQGYITNQNYNLESPNLYDVQGLPAIDYLINGIEDPVAFYTSNAEATNYKKYLKEITSRMTSLTKQVVDDWQGNFRADFIANDGYTSTSSTDVLVNYYVIPFFEKQFRENKIATPSGARTGIPVASSVEAYYKRDISKKLYITALNAAKNFYKGVGFNGSTGQSLQQYLEFLNKNELATLINTKFDVVTTKSNALEDDFVNQITTDKSKMLDTFDAIQEVLRQGFKPDMMSALSITNTSTDVDND